MIYNILILLMCIATIYSLFYEDEWPDFRTVLKRVTLIIVGSYCFGWLIKEFDPEPAVLILAPIVAIGTWVCIVEYKRARKEKDILEGENEEIRKDLLAILRFTNVICFSSDVKLKKQSTLARAVFTHEDVVMYNWRHKDEDEESFWYEEDHLELDLNDDTEDEFFLIQDRINFLKENFPKKIQALNRKYSIWNDGNFLSDVISEKEIKAWAKRLDKITG